MKVNKLKPKYAGDLDVKGKLFGVIFEKLSKSHAVVHLYVEDDEVYHHATCFDARWTKDLIDVMQKTLGYK